MLALALLWGCSQPSEAGAWGAEPWQDVLELNDAGDGSTSLPGVSPAPPPLQVGALSAGRPWTLRIDGAPVGADVHVALSPRGRGVGPCLPVALGGCLGVAEPVMHLGTLKVGPGGSATLTVTAPARLSASYAAQALIAPPGGEAWFMTAPVDVTPR